MGLFDWFGGQFIDVIDWLDDTHHTIVYRFDRQGNEIKNGAKLIVRPGQKAIFVNEGQIADILGPGTYELTTNNLPVLSDLQHWDHGFESPFKAEVYFVSTTRFSNLKWGTKTPIILNDPLFGPIRVRAYGSYEIRVEDPAKFLKEVVGTDGYFTTEEIEGRLASIILANLPQVLAKSGIDITQLAWHYKSLGEKLKKLLQPYFKEYGLSLENFFIESVSLPEDVQKALDDRSAISILSDMQKYMEYKTAQGIAKGGASDLVGLGAGMAAAQRIVEKGTIPPIPQESFYVAKDGKPTGPFTKSQLQELVGQQQLKPEDLVWKEGMEQWQKAKEAIQDIFSHQPPPIDE